METLQPKFSNLACKTHGVTEFVLSSGYYKCKSCRKERVAEQRRKNKRMLLAEFGGSCVNCGYDKCAAALQFHHIDPTTKEFGLAQQGHTIGYDRLVEEAKKCILLCANCHVEVENGITMVGGRFGKTASC